jgi:hypothetical protein
MADYRVRMLGRSREDGFTVTRLEGDHWVWLPVRFSTYSEADQWITQQQYEADRAIAAARRTSERTT